MKTCTCPCSSPNPFCSGKRSRGGLCARSRLGDPRGQRKSWPSACACGLLRRRCSANTIRISYSPGATCPSSTTSGAALCAGKDDPAVPAQLRVFVAGGAHHARHGRGGDGGDHPHAQRVCGLCGKLSVHPRHQGRKTDSEKFAGAEATFTIEPMMHDGKALQGGTSHYFGDGFARAFEITYLDKQNTLQHPFQTSWGMSTRIMGAIIMTHRGRQRTDPAPGGRAGAGRRHSRRPAQAGRAGQGGRTAGNAAGGWNPGQGGHVRPEPGLEICRV